MPPTTTPGPVPSPRAALRADLALLAACLGAAALVSLRLGQDANWDLQNYHYYNPWAWLRGRIFGHDIVAAQLQTFHNPLPDLPFYAMVAAGWTPRAIAVALALPAGAAAFFYAKLVPLLFRDLPPADRRVAVGAAIAVGATPAVGLGVVGTTMNEWPLVALVMAAVWLVARALVRGGGGALPLATCATAGLLCGLAAGLKLTAAVYAVGLCAGIALRGPHVRAGVARALREVLAFGLAVLAGLAVAYGPWAWALGTTFGSPVFPYFNDLVRSPWWPDAPVFTRRYGPHTLAEWLRFPFNLMEPGGGFVTEVSYRDARMPAAYGLALIAGAAWIAARVRAKGPLPAPADRGVSRAWQVVAVFFASSFVLWTAQHSVYRYAIPLDMLTGAIAVTLLWRLVRPEFAAGVVLLLAAALVALTRPPDWWRVDFGPHWFDVRVPAVARGAMVVITTDAPVGYLLPFFPEDARHVGVANTVVRPGLATRLSALAADAVRGHGGPLYQLASPPGTGAEALAAHGLARDEATCAPVRGNLGRQDVELCRVTRTGPPPTPAAAPGAP